LQTMIIFSFIASIGSIIFSPSSGFGPPTL
jgi:hypothetical protein